MTGLPIELYDVRNTLFRVTEQIEFDGYTVPIGFCTDLTSAPRPTRIFFPRWQIINKPPIIHDWLYATHITSRKEADEVFLRAMLSAGYDKPRAYAQYLGVRALGWYGYYYSSPRKMKERTPELFAAHFAG